ncbi:MULTISPECIES: GNAT family N-acetyltransferase [Shouchella]|uniref:GNAT family N-acetyltransferase n=2 Tax=Shouchella TaxID=2893057 RepID=A0ABY7W9M2_9BACI|nr:MULTISPECIES: GNAT family N-acetyltransferase [Shouchella]MED4128064.1 GNAT family N-acetyltransferase [Shouchella miscanthi]WDF05618.1 GNAT family N-acetyltransferase [Shouchella hunanensis]
MQVVKATLEDAETILALQKVAYQSEAALYNDYTILPLHETIENAQEAFSSHLILKALDDQGSILGSVRGKIENGVTKIGKLMVHPSAQNQGVGRALMEAIEKELPSPTYALFTGSKSEKNLFLYQKLGYTIVSYGSLPGEATVFAFLEKRSEH